MKGDAAKTILCLDRLGKAYQVGRARPDGRDLTPACAALRSLSRPVPHDPATLDWAIADVTFSVARGEVVGLIGPNGAGKSTLLNVLNRTAVPTCGRVTSAGRVVAALDAWSEFCPEYTGRENIGFRGAVLGMTRLQLRGRLDELAAFSEIERFLDTPVKRYSLGMAVRLSLAVATHLDSEVLLVDELLSYGDAAFREQCLARIRYLADVEGRAVLFVSQDMTAVDRLCRRAILLRRGRVVADGPTEDVVREHLASAACPSDAAASPG